MEKTGHIFHHQLFTLIFCFILCQSINIQTTLAEGPASAFSVNYARLLVSDTTHTLTAPARWGQDEWIDFALYTGGIGAVMLLDKPIYKEIQKNRTTSADNFARLVQEFGSYPSFGIMGAFYAGGSLLDNDKAKTVAMDAFASSFVSAGIITTTLKIVSGRSRPIKNEGTYHFTPFGGDDSFPSGHTTQAFALASVIAEHYDEQWIDITSYGIATLVGLARVEQEAHFPSDVVAGAVIGTVVGKSIVRYNKEKHTNVNVTFAPIVDSQTIGGYFKVEF